MDPIPPPHRPGWAARLAMRAIRLYQRHLSPHKGFACAHRLHRGGASCSSLAWRAIRRHGLFSGLLLTRRRTRRCAEVHARCRHPPSGLTHRAQRGACDLPCDGPGCELPCDPGSAARHLGGWISCCDCGSCDWPRRRQPPPRSPRRQTRRS